MIIKQIRPRSVRVLANSPAKLRSAALALADGGDWEYVVDDKELNARFIVTFSNEEIEQMLKVKQMVLPT